MFVKHFLLKRVILLILFAFLGLITPLGVQVLSVKATSVTNIEKTPVLTTNNTNPRQLVQQGTNFYEAGQFAEAISIWKRAVDAFAAKGDKLGQAMALSNLSLTYQQLGQWEEAGDAIRGAIAALNAQSLFLLKNSNSASNILAQTLNIQGRLQLSLGQTEQAIDTYQRAANLYKQVGDQTGLVRSLINQSQALQGLGLYHRALKILNSVNDELNAQPDSIVKAAGLRSLGNTLLIVGDIEQAEKILQQSLEIAQKLNAKQGIAETLLSLGNAARARQNIPAALTYYEQAETTPSSNTQLQARLNRFSLLLEEKQLSTAQKLLPIIQNNLANPPSRTSVYARINLAQTLLKFGNELSINAPDIAQILVKAVQEAKSLQDLRAESFALGNLGTLYEKNQQVIQAQDLTQQALLLAQQIKAVDISYRWQWQLGRLLKTQKNLPGAIAAYQEAFSTLQSLRSDLVAVNPEVQFSFRDSVEPVYRQYVDVLLQVPGEKNLVQARNTIEALQLAELDNFFRDACLNVQRVDIDRVDDPNAAVVYPIILEDRIELILSLPGKPLRHYTTPKSQTEINPILVDLPTLLQSPGKPDPDLLLYSQKLYDWLIRPAETDLKNSNIKTLVFVLDSSLRNIPMAILHDGNQYLVEQYSIALTPGMQLVKPQPLTRKGITALAAGVSETRENLPPLPHVEAELQLIRSEVSSEELLNQSFTSTAIQSEIKLSSFPIVHIATHGNFSSQADETYILAWDRRIKVKELDDVLQTGQLTRREPLELLVLSACETAQGDNRAALGLAGIAVRAGARSTLATLWQVSDQSTALLIGQFYKELVDGKVSKAEALRRAQLSILKDNSYQVPYYWAPFVLVGNWL
jgi:CHAT domain-containing protein